MSDEKPDTAELPKPVVRGRRRQDTLLIWLVPIVAALAGLVLIVRSWQSAGPTIEITFKTAEGLDDTTTVKFKNVVVGTIERIRLSEDRQNVIVRVNVKKDVEEYLVEDTRFWVERPRADLGGISGLSTLVSGAYIGMDVGVSTEPRESFVGLEQPPAITHDQKGLQVQLSADNLGSLNVGSPIYFRQIQVGKVVDFELDDDGRAVTLQAFIDAPYDKYVSTETRFWNISGVNIALDADGLQINAQSLLSLLLGGLAFDTLPGVTPQQAAAHSRYLIYPNREVAMAVAERPSVLVRMRFFQSVRGLAPGAPVEFTGLDIGEVINIGLDYDRERKKVYAEVTAELFPERMGPVYRKLQRMNGASGDPETTLLRLLEHGLRAQLRSASLITGQLFVGLDLPSKPERRRLDLASRPLEIPTITGGVDQIITQLGEIAEKLNKMPLEQIGQNLNRTLASADQLLRRLDRELAPEAKAMLSEVRATLGSVRSNLESPDSSLIQDASSALDEVGRAARSLRNLGDYLQRHPEALLRGKPQAAAPEPQPEESPHQPAADPAARPVPALENSP